MEEHLTYRQRVAGFRSSILCSGHIFFHPSFFGVFFANNGLVLVWSIYFLTISIFMHQSFVVLAPEGPGNSGAFSFSVCKAWLNPLHCGDKFMVKSLLKVPAPWG